MACQLTNAANNVVKLHKRISDQETSSTFDSTTDMVTTLDSSIAKTLGILQGVLLERFTQNNRNYDNVKRLTDLLSQGLGKDQNTCVRVMQQYSDILLSMMQQKIQNSNDT